ncbi:prepilin-type N-terminal cleavage/methylation domain-containing protein [Opitutaceae bacterium TAV1]|nr:N-terminal cleavage protein [Opitutaceae bacterium TAV5]EIP99917.1 prepilin-type N-terminal cleavage/methylation domain-containing protein [Opitutaceae bacterium TAV1]
MNSSTSYPHSPITRFLRRQAFTLIELLTVIAIIGILAAIIIPVTAKVRQSARAAQCQSNMRQIALAVILHANEQRNNTLPGPLYGKVFPAIMQNNKKGRLAWFLAPQFQTTMINNEVIMIPVMVCPGFAVARPDLIGVADSENAIVHANNTRSDIIPGYDGTVWGNPDASAPKNSPVPLHSIPTPSRVWMLTDMDAELAKSWSYSWGDDKMAPSPVHGSRRNRAFFDGHVASVGLKEPQKTW